MRYQKLYIVAAGFTYLLGVAACKQSNTKQSETQKPAEQQAATAQPAPPIGPATPPQAPEAPSGETGHLLGVWFDEEIKSPDGQKVAYEIVASKDKRIFIQVITFSGTKLTVDDIPPISPSATELKKTGEMYVSKASPNEFYKVDKKGTLLIYDETGLVAQCKKIL